MNDLNETVSQCKNVRINCLDMILCVDSSYFMWHKKEEFKNATYSFI